MLREPLGLKAELPRMDAGAPTGALLPGQFRYWCTPVCVKGLQPLRVLLEHKLPLGSESKFHRTLEYACPITIES